MNSSQTLKQALESNRLFPSRPELKRMVNAGRWIELGRLFNFEPVFLTTDSGKKYAIDWRCVPEALYSILQKPARTRTVPRMKLSRCGILGSSSRDRVRTFHEQKGLCYYCGQLTIYANWTIDHLTPLSRGGMGHASNKVGACKTCNNSKGCLTLAEFKACKDGKEVKQKLTAVQNRINGRTKPLSVTPTKP